MTIGRRRKLDKLFKKSLKLRRTIESAECLQSGLDTVALRKSKESHRKVIEEIDKILAYRR